MSHLRHKHVTPLPQMSVAAGVTCRSSQAWSKSIITVHPPCVFSVPHLQEAVQPVWVLQGSVWPVRVLQGSVRPIRSSQGEVRPECSPCGRQLPLAAAAVRAEDPGTQVKSSDDMCWALLCVFTISWARSFDMLVNVAKSWTRRPNDYLLLHRQTKNFYSKPGSDRIETSHFST